MDPPAHNSDDRLARIEASLLAVAEELKRLRPSPGPRVLLVVSEVAVLCGVSPKTVRRWIADEGLPTVRIRAAGARQAVFVRPGDLDAWIEARQPESAEEAEEAVLRLDGRRFTEGVQGKRA